MRPPALVTLVAVATVVGAAPGAATASAAEVRVDRACYADPGDRRDAVRLTGTGFTPGATYQVTLDGKPLAGGTGRTDAAGAMSGSFVAPRVASASRSARLHTFRLGVEEGVNAPETTFTVSRLLASFAPATGTLRTLVVRFSVFGFGLQAPARPLVYLHYVRPGGALQRTVRLGRASAPCGGLRSARRRLFDFGARRGLWRLQFDTRSRYDRGSARSSFLFYAVGARVR